MEVLRISHRDTWLIRHKMLRADFPYEECSFPGDEDGRTFHIGAFDEGKLVAVASFYYENNQAFPAPHQYRLRGMATLPAYQTQGFARTLLQTAFPIIKQNMCKLLWCHARSSAIEFYQKSGMEKYGDEFDIPGIGPHFLMWKPLENSGIEGAKAK